jgi:hypothetical protein
VFTLNNYFIAILFSGIMDMARSVMAVMVREGFTPGLADTALPSHT